MNNLFTSFKKLIANNLVIITIILAVTIILNYLALFPYFSSYLLFPHTWNLFIIIFLLIVLLFNLNETFSFCLSFIFLGLTVLLTAIGKDSLAESIGNIVYSLLLFGVIQMIISRWRSSRKHT